MNRLLTSNLARHRLARTIIQGVIGVLQIAASGNITARAIGRLAANSTVYCSVMYIV